MKDNPDQPAAKLANLLAELVAKRDGLKSNAAAARTKADSTTPPAAFDETAAVQRISRALADDALSGTTTAEAEKAKVYQERTEAAAAITDYRAMVSGCRETADRLEAEAATLLPQIVEIDRLIRAEVAQVSMSDLEQIEATYRAKAGELADLLAEYLAAASLLTIGRPGTGKYEPQIPGISTKPLQVPMPLINPGKVLTFSTGTISEKAQQARAAFLDKMTGGHWPSAMESTHWEVLDNARRA